MLSALLFLLPFPEGPPEWLAGHWCTAPQSGRQTCEHWVRTPGGLAGRSEVRRGDGATPGETMRIERRGERWVFHAEPRGQAPTDFGAVAVTPEAISFENRDHDYPQRVRYWREGAALMAEVSLADGSRAMRWTFHRIAE